MCLAISNASRFVAVMQAGSVRRRIMARSGSAALSQCALPSDAMTTASFTYSSRLHQLLRVASVVLVAVLHSRERHEVADEQRAVDASDASASEQVRDESRSHRAVVVEHRLGRARDDRRIERHEPLGDGPQWVDFTDRGVLPVHAGARRGVSLWVQEEPRSRRRPFAT